MSRLSRIKLKNEDIIIWCNSQYKFNDQVLNYKHWSKSGIRFISELLSNGCINPGEIYEKLIYKAAFMFEIEIVRKTFSNVLNIDSFSLIEKYRNEGEILNMAFEVPTVGVRKLCDLKSSDIYKIFTLTEHVEMKSKKYWQSKFKDININFDLWFKVNFSNKITPRRALDFNWRIFHGQICTENLLKHMSYSDGLCVLCKEDKENLEHILINCKQVNSVWKNIEVLIRQFIDTISLDRVIILGGLRQSENSNVSIINMILSITRWMIWKRRCTTKYENEEVTINELEEQIKNEIYCHTNILLKTSLFKKYPTLKHMLDKLLVLTYI